jgi:hypothetical protein
MPHGGYHGVVKVGDTIVQQGSPAGAPPGQGGQYNPDGYATEMAGSPAPAQNNQTAKQLEEQIKQQMAKDEDPRSAYIAAQADAARLTNLIKKEQEEAFRRRIINRATPGGLSSITRLTSDPVDIEQGFVRTEPGRLRRSDLLGYSDGLFGLNIGATPVVGLANIDVNPITGERITTAKAREGLTTPEYNEFIQKLYDTNPQLFEEQFPVASGQALKPLIARILEGDLGSGIGSFIDSATGAIFKPRGGTVRPSDGGISNIRVDNFGETVPGSEFFKAGSGDVTERNMPLFTQVPEQFREGFLKFYNEYEGPIVGGAAITGVTLPDGSVVEFGDTGSARVFREYLESLGISQPPATGVDKIASQPTGISKFDVDKFYASLPQYTQQGIMSPNLSRFTDALRMFPGATV